MNCQACLLGRRIALTSRIGGDPEPIANAALWATALTTRLDLANPHDHAGIIADSVREAVRLCRDGVLVREIAINVLVTAARIFAMTIAEIEEASMRRRRFGALAGLFHGSAGRTQAS
jgi:hypothetical protein